MLAMACFQKQKTLFICLAILTIVFWLNLAPSVAELQRLEHQGKSDESLSFLVIGDWGRGGLYNQSEIAFQVSKPLFFHFKHLFGVPINRETLNFYCLNKTY